jgi:colanic acid/amylovoran biosynthesis glycosyltransferase
MSSSKRIAYLVSQYPAVNHTYIVREVRELRRLGWDIHVASIRPDTRPAEQLTREEQEERASTWCAKTQGFARALIAHLACLATRPRSYARGLFAVAGLAGADLRKAAWNLLYFTEALLVGRWMQSRDLAHVHIHYASTVGLFLAKSFPIDISITIHGSGEFEDPRRFHLRAKIQAATFVRAISNYGRSQLMKASDPDQWSKFELVPLGIDPQEFAARARLDDRRDTFELLSVGQLTPAKAQRILIEAVARLTAQGRKLRLRLVGDGPERAALENYIVANGLSAVVSLEGALNQDQLKAFYARCDAFVLPSFAEGIPVVLMEAMAMQIPCVATWITGIPELIQDGVDGLLVPPSDVAQLADAIARLIDDPALSHQIANVGRRKVVKGFNLGTNIDKLAAMFTARLSLSNRFNDETKNHQN